MLLDIDPFKIILRHNDGDRDDEITIQTVFTKYGKDFGDVGGLPVVPHGFGVFRDEARFCICEEKPVRV